MAKLPKRIDVGPFTYQVSCDRTTTEMTGLALVWGSDDEDFVRRLTPSLLDVLRRNPKLVAYLTAVD